MGRSTKNNGTETVQKLDMETDAAMFKNNARFPYIVASTNNSAGRRQGKYLCQLPSVGAFLSPNTIMNRLAVLGTLGSAPQDEQ
jgi:hypothetical protein